MKALKKSCKVVALGFGALAFLVFIGLPSQAYALALCAVGNTCVDHLTNTNVAGVTINIDVSVNNTGSKSVITVSFVSDNISNTPLGIDQFGYASLVPASVLQTGWKQASNCPVGGCKMDGFGSFLSEIDSPGGTDLTFSFTLASLVTTFPANDHGAEWAAHIRYSGSCSGFVSDGTTDSIGSAGGCVTVPEPSTLFLLGSGLIALGLLGRRRFKRITH